MARKIVHENVCDACGASAFRTNDKEFLDATDKDTELPPWWVELTIRVKQPNPDYVALQAAEVQIRKETDKRLPATLKKAAAEKSKDAGKPVTLVEEEIDVLRDMLEQQIRNATQIDDLDDDPSPMVVMDGSEEEDDPEQDGTKRFVLCPDHAHLITTLGIDVFDTHVADGNSPPWKQPAAPAASTKPSVVGEVDEGEEVETPDDPDGSDTASGGGDDVR